MPLPFCLLRSIIVVRRHDAFRKSGHFSRNIEQREKKWYNIDMEDKDEKVYIFVSHSHKDINKVRLVRNYLEDRGAEPILFFLKSVTDDNEIEEVVGTVTGTGTYQGAQVIFVDGEMYPLSNLMAVGTLPEIPEEPGEGGEGGDGDGTGTGDGDGTGTGGGDTTTEGV